MKMNSTSHTHCVSECRPSIGRSARRSGLRTAAGRRGFTLIELLVVVAILGILAVIAMAVGSNVKQKAQIAKTKTTLTMLQGVLEEYERDTGTAFAISPNDTTTYVQTFLAYPKTKDTMNRLVGDNSNLVVLDGFGKPIQIVSSPKRGFTSLGPSGNGGADSINSWDPQ